MGLIPYKCSFQGPRSQYSGESPETLTGVLLSGYTPVFSSIYDGTLYGKWPAAAVFATLLPLADVHGNVDMSYEAIAGRTGWPIELLQLGISQLMEPDKRSRSPNQEGRRMVMLDPERPWGWHLVNHSLYREKARLSAKNAREVSDGKNAKRMSSRKRPPETAADPLSNSYTNSNSNHTHVQEHSDSEHQDAFASIRLAYPKFSGDQDWIMAEHYVRNSVDHGDRYEDIIAGVTRYATYVDNGGVSSSAFVLGPGKFFKDRKWKQAWDPPPTKADARLGANIDVLAGFIKGNGNAGK